MGKWVEDRTAVGMRCCGIWVGRWGGWVGWVRTQSFFLRGGQGGGSGSLLLLCLLGLGVIPRVYGVLCDVPPFVGGTPGMGWVGG